MRYGILSVQKAVRTNVGERLKGTLTKTKKLWIWKAYDCIDGRLIDWELGGRDSKTLSKLLGRLSQWQVTVLYCTDDWKPY
jgi:IS1 family transposase